MTSNSTSQESRILEKLTILIWNRIFKTHWPEVRRREGDLNSRVQGTVDFESTAIPGYAISACIPPTYTTVIRVMSLGWFDEGRTEGLWA